MIWQAMSEVSPILHTLQGIYDAVQAEDQEEGLAGVTILLLQFEETFGHDPRIWRGTFPVLEELRTCIQSRNFERAHVITLAFLAKFRSVAKRLEASDGRR